MRKVHTGPPEFFALVREGQTSNTLNMDQEVVLFCFFHLIQLSAQEMLAWHLTMNSELSYWHTIGLGRPSQTPGDKSDKINQEVNKTEDY